MSRSWHIDALSKQYGKKQALQLSQLSFDAGQITGLLGVNGAGKSTLLKCMLGLVAASGGSAERDDGNAYIGHLPEIAHLPNSISALQLVRHALRLKNGDPAMAEDHLGEIGLDSSAWTQPLRSYSKGMRQRAALAFALAGQPAWIILDEPMSGLDAVGRKQILRLLERYHQNGSGIIICSHIVPDLVRLCERVLIMAKGRVCEDVRIVEHSMAEAERLEASLEQWSMA